MPELSVCRCHSNWTSSDTSTQQIGKLTEPKLVSFKLVSLLSHWEKKTTDIWWHLGLSENMVRLPNFHGPSLFPSFFPDMFRKSWTKWRHMFPCFPQHLPENPDITFFSKALHSLEPCQPWVALAPRLPAAQAERPATWGEADSAWYWCAWSRFPDPDLGWSPWKCWGEAWPIVIISHYIDLGAIY